MQRLKRFLRGSLGARLVVGLATMLLPLAFLAVGVFIGFESIMKSFLEVTEEMVEEIHPNHNLQKDMIEVRLRFASNLSPGEKRYPRSLFFRVEKISRDFNELLKDHQGVSAEKTLIKKAERRWQDVVSLSRIISASADPRGDPAARRALARIDSDIGSATTDMVRANKIDLKEVTDEFIAIKTGRLKSIAVVLGAFFLGISGAVYVGLILGRSIMGPLRLLGDGAHRLGAGELSFRVNLPNDDELGRLGDDFNIMAQRLEADQAALADLATHDGLTGLYNRREIFKILDDEIQRSKRYAYFFSVLVIDIDHFKAVNDSFGHQAGDRVLRGLAGLMTETVRPIDKVGRYGGEEFIVILPQTGNPGALATAERLRRVVIDNPASISDGQRLALTVSIGLAVFPSDAGTGDELVNQADIALYEAKEAGRNMTRHCVS